MFRFARLLGAGFLVALLLLASGCGGGGTKHVAIGTAQAGGTYVPIGMGIAELINKNLQGYNAAAEETGGAIENMNLLDTKQIDIGFSTITTAINALKGGKPFEHPITTPEPILRISETPIHFITLDPSLKTVADLKGKKVSLGAAGSGGNVSVAAVLTAHGIAEKDYNPTYLGTNDAVESLADGAIDAMALISSVPASALEGLAARKKVYLLDVDPDALVKNLKDLPTTTVKVPAGTYKGQDKDAVLYTMNAYIWAREDVDENLITNVVRLTVQNIDYLKTLHPQAGAIKVIGDQEAADLGKIGFKIHPGALKAAKELAGKTGK